MKLIISLIFIMLFSACSPSPSDFSRLCLDGVSYWSGNGQLAVAVDRQGNPVACTRERKLNQSEKELVDIADYWVRLLDKGKVEENWKESSRFFQREITLSKWREKVGGVRKPLGGVLSRKAINLSENMGHKVVIFRTFYVKEEEPLIETVALMKENNIWKVSGYFIKDEY
jgi:hypothetical protein